MTDKTSKENLKGIVRAIYDEIHRVPEYDEDFDYEEELSVIARDYPESFEKSKKELTEDKTGQFNNFINNRDGLVQELEIMTPELVEPTRKRINTLDSKLVDIIEWFTIWDIIKIDKMRTFRTYKSINEQKSDPEIKDSLSSQQKIHISKQNALKLLMNLEDPDYVISDDDEKHFKDKNFRTYRSEYINDRNHKYYNEALDLLITYGQLTHTEFLQKTVCPSEWYNDLYIRSFTYHCENPRGKFFNKCKYKKFKSDSRIRVDEAIEPVLAFSLR